MNCLRCNQPAMARYHKTPEVCIEFLKAELAEIYKHLEENATQREKRLSKRIDELVKTVVDKQKELEREQGEVARLESIVQAVTEALDG